MIVLSILDQIIPRLQAGETLAFCTVVNSRGSTPQERGAKMAVLASGQTIGTLGGGCVEAEVRAQTLRLMDAGKSKLMTFRLDHDYGWDDGLICGGIMDIYVDVLTGPCSAEKFLSLAGSIRKREPVEFQIDYHSEAGPQTYREEILPPPKLVIAGAGHVGQALAELAARLDFDVTVIDDRVDCASEQRFPNAMRIVGDIETELSKLKIDGQTYVVIVTRGHRHDGHALAAVIRSPARYIGLIGSKRKVRTILGDLHEQGIPIEQLSSVHAPIGLEIGAVTVGEIAISIAAELIAVRHGRSGQSAEPLKISRPAIESWINRKDLAPPSNTGAT